MDISTMSDEDFAQLNISSVVSEAAIPPEQPEAEVITETPAVVIEEEAPVVIETPVEPITEAAPVSLGSPTETPVIAEDAVPDTPAVETDYRGFYDKVMAPLTANGKTIEIRSPDEAVQLMQMGANYTKKMQTLAPYRKVLTMLENHNLLDESKLGFLIDLDKKNPEAIKKLLKESGVDPMDIDTSVEPVYSEGNHRVSDEEVNFRTTLEDIQSAPAGNETLQMIHTQWDQASKDVLWKEPELMQVIHEQRTNGIYAQVVAELDRQRTLGAIPTNLPFIHAYKLVGDQLVSRNAIHAPQVVAPVAPIATKSATPQRMDNAARAGAAAPVRTTPAAAKPVVNPLAMDDDEFMKHMQNRL